MPFYSCMYKIVIFLAVLCQMESIKVKECKYIIARLCNITVQFYIQHLQKNDIYFLILYIQIIVFETPQLGVSNEYQQSMS